MRVLLDTTFALRGPSGTAVYVRRLADALQRAGVEVVPAANQDRREPAGGGLRSVANLAADAWWTSVELPRRARRARADVLHHPLPAHAVRAGIPQVITVHDLAFELLPEQFDAAYRRFAHHSHRSAARRAQAVVAVSEATARDIAEYWGVARDRIVVARHGPGQEPHGSRPGGGGHLLYVGDCEPRKNLGLLLAAYRRYRAEAEDPLGLVLAGSARAGGDGITLVERPGTRELTTLYAGAAALVHPSLHEGFGLTPLEAMSAGVPVLAARSPGVEEVCGDAVVYVDAHDPRDLAAALGRVAGDAALRRDLAERGRRRAAEFSWARSARAHLAAYTLAVG